MTASHLLNAINHHRKQVDLLVDIAAPTGDTATVQLEYVVMRQQALEATIETLIRELITRDPERDDDHEGPSQEDTRW